MLSKILNRAANSGMRLSVQGCWSVVVSTKLLVCGNVDIFKSDGLKLSFLSLSIVQADLEIILRLLGTLSVKPKPTDKYGRNCSKSVKK